MSNKEKNIEFLFTKINEINSNQQHEKFYMTCYNLRNIIYTTLSIGLEKYTNPQELVLFLKKKEIEKLILEVSTKMPLVFQKSKTENFSVSWAGSRYEIFTDIQICWLLKDFTISKIFLDWLKNKDLFKNTPKEPFLEEYSKGIVSFSEKTDYLPIINFKLKGLERYWANHLSLISKIISGEDFLLETLEIKKSFEKQNLDKRIKDDSLQIEGSFLHPIKIDFRTEALKSYSGFYYDSTWS